MENKQLNLSEPENIMGTMDVNPLLIKLSIPMMISMLCRHCTTWWTRSLSPVSVRTL